MDKEKEIESQSYCCILYYEQVTSVIFPCRNLALKGQLYKSLFAFISRQMSEYLETAEPYICYRNIEK